jgi:hypothetical protein
MVLEGDIRRVSRVQKWFSFYQFQHIYLFVLYGVLGLKFRIQAMHPPSTLLHCLLPALHCTVGRTSLHGWCAVLWCG